MNRCQSTLVEESDGEDFFEMKKINEEDTKKKISEEERTLNIAQAL